MVTKLNWTEEVPISATNMDLMEKNTLDVSSGHTHDGADSKLINSAMIVLPNINSIRLANAYSAPNNENWNARTGAVITLTNTKSPGKILLSIRSQWYTSDAGTDTPSNLLYARINRDSGSEYIYLGVIRLVGWRQYGFLGGDILYTGLSIAEHTFQYEQRLYLAGNNYSAYNDCTDAPLQKGIMELIAREI